MSENCINITPKVVIDISKYRLRIHRTTIKALGNPEYVLLLANPDEKTIAILPTEKNDKKAHRIKYDNHSCEIYSMLLLDTIRSLDENFKVGQKYIITGKIVLGKNLAVFNLEEATAFNSELEFFD